MPKVDMNTLQDEALPLLDVLQKQESFEAYAVGGYVRDAILHIPSDDLDVVVAGGRGPEMATKFALMVGASKPKIYKRFGTALVSWNDRKIEFASARTESYPTNSRKPTVKMASIQDDVLRRDFTINAMLMRFNGEIYDPLNGYIDLEHGLLRTPLPSNQTFTDDPLRMLRAIRFATRFDFELDNEIIESMKQMSSRLGPPVVSSERIRIELEKMLLGPDPARALRLIRDGGLLPYTIPELIDTIGCAQPDKWHRYDVFDHTLEVIKNTPPQLPLRLAGVYHDVGKPITKDAEGHFLEHEHIGAQMAGTALANLRFSQPVIDEVVALVKLHMRPIAYLSSWHDSTVRRLAREAGELIEPLIEFAKADIKGSGHPDITLIEELETRINHELSKGPQNLGLQLPVTGEDIMELLSIKPGKEVGKIKKKMSDAVAEGVLSPDKDSLILWVKTQHSHEMEI